MEKLPLREKVAYGLGDFASSIFWTLFSMFLLFFYTDVFGITAAAAGTMFLVVRLWDTVNDPLMGMIGDRTSTRWGKFRPYLLFVAFPFAIIGVLTFTTPDLSSTGRLIYAYITYTLMMMVYTAINVPYSSMLGVMTKDSGERTSLASFRFLGGFAGGLLVTATANSLIDYFGAEAGKATGFQVTIGIYSLIAACAFLLTFAGTKERLDPEEVAGSSFREDLRDLSKNKPWFIMLGAALSVLIFNSLRGSAILYYFKYFVGDQNILFFGEVNQGVLSAAFMTIGQVAAILGVLTAIPLAGRIGKKNSFMLSGLVCAGLSVLFFFIPSDQISLIFVIHVLISMSSSLVFPLIWAMYGDVSDYSEWKTGHRATGLIFSSSSMSQKMGWTIGGAISGWILASFGFVANEVQTDESLLGIRLMISLFAAVGALMSVGFMSFYPLSEKYMAGIKEKMETART
ncbi:MAG: MFS transporter [Candidatus Marinimicrobia bacterium]|nr:MFS transporter [Candidatus Neomarinimicrobiota bacterium]MBT4713182.1 MFS transporter [Candidatus Neomarinimicrobiota bacterium]MBT4945957.1 MFS transporter [Candidatus Neomarinimicrobiota bacterium]MBT5268784.1 MFS transporter [Candidatus Neomarinimicrobiota bacterium]